MKNQTRHADVCLYTLCLWQRIYTRTHSFGYLHADLFISYFNRQCNMSARPQSLLLNANATRENPQQNTICGCQSVYAVINIEGEVCV